MSSREWNDDYAAGHTPWDTGEPDPNLTTVIEAGTIEPGRMLEIGCGTGTNARWLCRRGFEVTAVDVAPLAIEQARAKAKQEGISMTLAVIDFLRDEVPGGPYHFVFDRGVFHTFDQAHVRARFAERVAAVLAPQGHWLSLAGSTEGPDRDHGPPRRSARDLMTAVEPSLELVELRSTEFSDLPWPAKAWSMLVRRRVVPAQPSSRHD